jgi:hypothetical protein
MMMKHLTFGTKRLELHLKEYLDLVKKIISGNMVQVHVAHVQKYIMTGEKSMAVENLAVR